MKHDNGTVDNHSIVERDGKNPVVVPGDLNDIARKRNDSHSSMFTRQGEENYDEINWKSKQRKAS